jgi:uncharacterized protein YbgA (DUF1722 family)
MTTRSQQDKTKSLALFAAKKLESLEVADLSGYVFKDDSPSCGVERVRILNSKGRQSRTAVGLFARAFMERFPLIPIEEDGRLCDPMRRDNFIERVFCYHRWRALARGPFTSKAVVEFHAAHKSVLLAHSAQHYQLLGRLVARVNEYRPKEFLERYGSSFMDALAVKATRRKHVNVLHHLVGHMKARLAANERGELDALMSEYRGGLVPLVAPIGLLRHYADRYEIDYVRTQIYVNPHPKEIQLRNHV